jgi:hypothetical protein
MALDQASSFLYLFTFFETGSRYAAQAGFELPNVGRTHVSHHAQLFRSVFVFWFFFSGTWV